MTLKRNTLELFDRSTSIIKIDSISETGNMNPDFLKWAEEAYRKNPDVILNWERSDDILERALANAVFEAVGK
ncbi:hypothetical protein V7O66_03080 [Methanolobus sp. ZRKC3]|uniref:hypothetical protein n=1 Tax=Methanolobus sp. ZRKC3 TaxID=3125786 RepID=UPI00324FDC27